jgi:soluble lytic murein transglycosylase
MAVGAPISAVQVDMIIRSSALTDLDGRRRVLTLIAVESSFNPDALSSRGAIGLTQTLPIARTEVDRVWPGQRPALPSEADVWYGSSYLRWCRDKFGSWTLAYMCYNAGPTATSQYLHVGNISRETLRYIVRMWKLYEENCLDVEN